MRATPKPSPAAAVPTPTPPPLPDEVLGTWGGTWDVPPDDIDNSPELYGSTTPLTFSLTLQPCSVGEPCGRQYARGTDASGEELGCGWDLIYDGITYESVTIPGAPPPEPIPWFRFREGPAQQVGEFKACMGVPACRDYVRLREDGTLQYKASCVAGRWEGPWDAQKTAP